MLQLPLAKPGMTAGKLTLSLNKGASFKIELAWDSPHDLDAHALLAINNGAGAKVSSLEQVLSTYNTKKNSPGGVLVTNPDGSFKTPCGSLLHSGDSRTGVVKEVDESITVDGSKVPNDVNEIPIFVTIHGGRGTFAEVKMASITIKDDTGKVLEAYQLTTEFAGFNAVQMGSLMLGANGWEFAAVGTGFTGDFNTVLGHFS